MGDFKGEASILQLLLSTFRLQEALFFPAPVSEQAAACISIGFSETNMQLLVQNIMIYTERHPHSPNCTAQKKFYDSESHLLSKSLKCTRGPGNTVHTVHAS